MQPFRTKEEISKLKIKTKKIKKERNKINKKLPCFRKKMTINDIRQGLSFLLWRLSLKCLKLPYNFHSFINSCNHSWNLLWHK